jgi:uncharacterized protein YecE (DUF72 family)
MRVFSGTSGYAYDEWRGVFYPPELKPGDYLGYFARRLPTVEINYTFYRMPKPDVVAAWYDQTPSGFGVALKASRRITHQQRLKESLDSVTYLFKVAAILKEKLTSVLFQLPPQLRKDVPRLSDFLAILPEGCRATFEFRHPSWFDDAVYACLRERGAALCWSDEDELEPPPIATAAWGYVRLRHERYTPEALRVIAERIAKQPWEQASVYFKHEETAWDQALRFQPLMDAVLGLDARAPEAAERGPGPQVRKAEPREIPAEAPLAVAEGRTRAKRSR